MRTKLVVGNWKMHGSRPANAELLAAIVGGRPYAADVAVCVPYVYLSETAAQLAGSDVKWGAQDVVGHSERRQYHAESDELVAAKAQAALARGITPIVCVGETLEQRDGGETENVVKRQLAAVIRELAHCAAEMVVAYEPVWAIGTGRTATPEQAQAVHAVLRAQLQAATGRGDAMTILYGGSVKADNALQLFAQPDIDGGLIGGASLKAADFIAICRAAN